jgi:large subunit ribosomal protein L24e
MKCSFCKGSVAAGSGKMFVKNTGEVFYFCSSKCEKNFMLGREPKKRKWSRGKK